tara:strand:- start:437 stop:571 length:135 start_codon:yes stop_codon:yes gene_type:complete
MAKKVSLAQNATIQFHVFFKPDVPLFSANTARAFSGGMQKGIEK